MKRPLPLLTICIPTCYGGISLVKAIRSLRAYSPSDTQFLVIADTIPLSRSIKNQLRELHVLFVENKTPKSQISKIKKMLRLIKSEYVIFTQDDITVSDETINNIISYISTNQRLTMMTVRNVPMKSKNWVDKGLSAGVHVAYQIENNWNQGQNYLRGCGRFLIFKTSFMKQFRLPENVVNVDAFLYFENQRLGGSFDRIENARMFYSLPTSLDEQIRKSSRYQYGADELSAFFSADMLDFNVPLSLKIFSTIKTILERPLSFIFYVPILGITRILRQRKRDIRNVLWKVDVSTK